MAVGEKKKMQRRARRTAKAERKVNIMARKQQRAKRRARKRAERPPEAQGGRPQQIQGTRTIPQQRVSQGGPVGTAVAGGQASLDHRIDPNPMPVTPAFDPWSTVTPEMMPAVMASLQNPGFARYFQKHGFPTGRMIFG